MEEMHILGLLLPFTLPPTTHTSVSFSPCFQEVAGFARGIELVYFCLLSPSPGSGTFCHLSGTSVGFEPFPPSSKIIIFIQAVEEKQLKSSLSYKMSLKNKSAIAFCFPGVSR